jgi:hypothetical protein
MRYTDVRVRRGLDLDHAGGARNRAPLSFAL